MPIYEYQCESCDERLEKLQRMSDPALRDCPHCNKPALKRLISAAGFRLKGSGWYETDFKQGNKRNIADSSSDNKPAKSEAKSAKASSGGDSSAKKPTSTKTTTDKA